jgi:hypothetical protein
VKVDDVVGAVDHVGDIGGVEHVAGARRPLIPNKDGSVANLQDWVQSVVRAAAGPQLVKEQLMRSIVVIFVASALGHRAVCRHLEGHGVDQAQQLRGQSEQSVSRSFIVPNFGSCEDRTTPHQDFFKDTHTHAAKQKHHA